MSSTATSVRTASRAAIFRRFPTFVLPPQGLTLIAVGAAAVLLGLAVAQEKWLYLVGAGGCVVAIFWPVEAALGVFGLLIPFDDILALGSGKHGTTVTWFVGAGAAGILLATGLVGKRLSLPPVSALWWSLFVVWAAMTSFWALDGELALHTLPTVFSLLLLYCVTVSLKVREKELAWITALVILGGCAAAIYAASEFRHGLYYHHTVRASLSFGNRQADPNEFAGNLLLPISLAIGSFGGARGFWAKVAAFAATAAMGLAVLFTMSRGAILALFTMVLVFLLRYRIRLRTVVPFSLLGVLLLVVPQTFFTRLAEAGSSGGAGRVYIWKVGEVILEHFGLIGAGLGNFPAAYNLYAGYAPVFMHYGKGSHNIYLNASAETGIVGLLLLLVAVCSQLLSANREAHSGAKSEGISIVPYEAACWAMLVAGFFLDVLWRKDFWFVWILLAIAIRAKRNELSESLS